MKKTKKGKAKGKGKTTLKKKSKSHPKKVTKRVKEPTETDIATAEELALQEYVDDDMDENNLGEEDFFETTIEGDNV